MALFDGIKNAISGVSDFLDPVKDIISFGKDILGGDSSKDVRGGTAKPFSAGDSSFINLQLTGSALGAGSQIPKQTVTTTPNWYKYLKTPGGEQLIRLVGQQINKTVVKQVASPVVNPKRRKT